MAKLVRFEGADGSFMWVEASVPGNDGRGDVGLVVDEGGVARAATRLEESLGSIRGAAVALMGAVDGLEGHSSHLTLDEVSLDLGLSFGVEGGVVVAKGSARAEASVSLHWKASAVQ